MTDLERNRDIKRLWKALKEATHNEIERIHQPEFVRLHKAGEWNTMHKDAILRMVVMNVRWKFVPLHLMHTQINELNL